MSPLIEAVRRSAGTLRRLPPARRRAAFLQLVTPLLDAFEEEARATGEHDLLQSRLEEIWRIGHEVGACEEPPGKAAVAPEVTAH